MSSQDPPVSAPPNAGVTGVHSHAQLFDMGAGNLNSGLQACTAVLLTHKAFSLSSKKNAFWKFPWTPE